MKGMIIQIQTEEWNSSKIHETSMEDTTYFKYYFKLSQSHLIQGITTFICELIQKIQYK